MAPSDGDMRWLIVVPAWVLNGAGLVASVIGPWSPAHRLALVGCWMLATAWAIFGRYGPWNRLPVAWFAVVPIGLILIFYTAIQLSGGWQSPFRTYIPLTILFGALVLSLRASIAVVAVAIAAQTVLVFESDPNIALSWLIVSTATASLLLYLVQQGKQLARQHLQTERGAMQTIEETERRAQGLTMLQRVSAIVARHLSLDDAIDAILHELEVAFGHHLVSIYLIEGDHLVMQAQRGYPHPIRRISLASGVAGSTVRRGTTTYLPDVSASRDFLAATEGLVSEICVPLLDEGEVVGILNVESRQRLTELDRDLMELFGAQVSVVVRNARQAGELRVQARHDALTGLLNQAALLEALDTALEVTGSRCGVLLLDLNDFKHINDTHGHLVGNAVLQHVAAAIRARTREGDVAGRFGGDEFVVVLPLGVAQDAELVASRIVEAIQAEPLRVDGAMIPITLSIGYAVAPANGNTREALLREADAAMYESKRRQDVLSAEA
jgi:diguanylate cyclase (GGDEF)-like protein